MQSGLVFIRRASTLIAELKKLHEDFAWGDVTFINSAEFMEMMGNRLLSNKPHIKSAVNITPFKSISRRQSVANYDN